MPKLPQGNGEIVDSLEREKPTGGYVRERAMPLGTISRNVFFPRDSGSRFACALKAPPSFRPEETALPT